MHFRRYQIQPKPPILTECFSAKLTGAYSNLDIGWVVFGINGNQAKNPGVCGKFESGFI